VNSELEKKRAKKTEDEDAYGSYDEESDGDYPEN